MIKYEITQAQGIKLLKLTNLDSYTTPLSIEDIKEAFCAIAKAYQVEGEMRLVLNNKKEMLNNENGICVLNDYIAFFGEKVFVNLGCCFFDLESLREGDVTISKNIIKELLPQAYNAQPLIMAKYAKRCYEKKQDALEIAKGFNNDSIN